MQIGPTKWPLLSQTEILFSHLDNLSWKRIATYPTKNWKKTQTKSQSSKGHCKFIPASSKCNLVVWKTICMSVVLFFTYWLLFYVHQSILFYLSFQKSWTEVWVYLACSILKINQTDSIRRNQIGKVLKKNCCLLYFVANFRKLMFIRLQTSNVKLNSKKINYILNIMMLTYEVFSCL